MNDQIRFHYPNADDPDWHVKIVYTLLIEAKNEMGFVIENLWKRGISYGRRSYPDFGQYVPITPFKAFCSAAAYAWADKFFGILTNVTNPEIHFNFPSVIKQ